MLKQLITAALLVATTAASAQNSALFTPLTYEAQNPLGELVDPATQYQNPILAGYYPDPSICRKGNDFYMVNSSFCHVPGLPVWHSTDLIHWELTGYAMPPEHMPDLEGKKMNWGLFAPQISYNPNNNKFYIINTCFYREGNFFVTSDDPKTGRWSEPTYLPDITGIDPSFFFDDNGRAWIVGSTNRPMMKRKDIVPESMGQKSLIAMMEFDWRTGKTIGEPRVIAAVGVHPAANPVALEGPHLYKINGKYFLLCAEGGTEPNHSAVIFSADSLSGTFTPCDINPILTQRDLPLNRSMKVEAAGHADLVQTASGKWYAVFLGVMPYEGDYIFNTGRQTFLLPVHWYNDQPVILEQGRQVPLIAPMDSELKRLNRENKIKGFDFYHPGPLWTKEELAPFATFIRNPKGNFYTIDGKGNLSMKCKPVSLDSLQNPAFIGERLTAMKFTAQTTLTFTPKAEGEEAGLVLFQKEGFYHKFVKTLNAAGQPVLRAVEQRGGKAVASHEVALSGKAALTLRVTTPTPAQYQYSYSADGGKTWHNVGEPLDARTLSTGVAGGFLGTFVGVYASSAK